MTSLRTIAVVTGSRADWGLLRPVMLAISGHRALDLRVVVTGTHLLPEHHTIDEVAAEFTPHAVIPMQRAGETGRNADAAALGRGVSGFAQWLAGDPPDVVLVLGDRIEPFAAAAAAAVAGRRVAHLHGGDRAPGIADESMRHAISKLAHVHLPATAASARRLAAMGEEERRIHVVGSPAIDGLDAIPPLDDEAFAELDRPEILFLLHPGGLPAVEERRGATRVLEACGRAGRVLALQPNHDPGREGIAEAIARSGAAAVAHLPRPQFVGLLRRVRILVGNSSAGLIEAAALGVPCINVGPRQEGRERAANVIDVPWPPPADRTVLEAAIHRGLATPQRPVTHPFGTGAAGAATAQVLATFDPDEHALAKKCTY